MMQERGVEADASTIFRWVQRYAPELEKRVRWYRDYRSGSWRVDATYVRVGGQWKYLFRAIDKHGRLIDFMLLHRRNTCAAYQFLGKAPKTMHDWPPCSNNSIEADHGAIKRVTQPTLGFQTMWTANAITEGFEIMRMTHRRHCIVCEPKLAGEIQLVNKFFDIAA